MLYNSMSYVAHAHCHLCGSEPDWLDHQELGHLPLLDLMWQNVVNLANLANRVVNLPCNSHGGLPCVIDLIVRVKGLWATAGDANQFWPAFIWTASQTSFACRLSLFRAGFGAVVSQTNWFDKVTKSHPGGIL